MAHRQDIRTSKLLAEVRRRLPPSRCLLQEAYTSEHLRPVQVRLADVEPNTFYRFDEMAARGFCDAVIELAGADGGNRLTVAFPFLGEFRAQRHRLEHLTGKVRQIRVLAPGRAATADDWETHDTRDCVLARYRLALCEGTRPVVFICRESNRSTSRKSPRGLGFFTFESDMVEGIAEDIEQVLHGEAKRLPTFDKLSLLHQITQQVERELESYSRRMEQAVRLARRRPESLTPERFERIVTLAVAKLEQLKKMPLEAMRLIGKHTR
jgi:hypothetical protein